MGDFIAVDNIIAQLRQIFSHVALACSRLTCQSDKKRLSQIKHGKCGGSNKTVVNSHSHAVFMWHTGVDRFCSQFVQFSQSVKKFLCLAKIVVFTAVCNFGHVNAVPLKAESECFGSAVNEFFVYFFIRVNENNSRFRRVVLVLHSGGSRFFAVFHFLKHRLGKFHRADNFFKHLFCNGAGAQKSGLFRCHGNNC